MDFSKQMEPQRVVREHTLTAGIPEVLRAYLWIKLKDPMSKEVECEQNNQVMFNHTMEINDMMLREFIGTSFQTVETTHVQDNLMETVVQGGIPLIKFTATISYTQQDKMNTRVRAIIDISHNITAISSLFETFIDAHLSTHFTQLVRTIEERRSDAAVAPGDTNTANFATALT